MIQRRTNLERWERGTTVPLTVAALLYLAAYAWPIIQPDLASGWRTSCRVTSWVTWAAFGLDYVIRLGLAPRRGEFIRHHLLDLAVVVLPMLRPLRLLRLVTLLHVLNRKASTSLRGRLAVYVVGATVLIVFVASLAALNTERRHSGANLVSFTDAWWWGIETITTVGYGDRYPVTMTGRLIAVGLMITGISILGIITAGLASWLAEKVRGGDQEVHQATRRDVLELSAEVHRLQAKLDSVSAALGQSSGTDDGAGCPSPPTER